ncbi:MAG: glycosyltransferase family 4 protein [Phycisphaerales bacterium]
MRIGYVSHYAADDIRGWSGTGYHIADCLKRDGSSVTSIGPLTIPRHPVNVAQYLMHEKLLGRRDHPQRDPGLLKNWAKQIHAKLATVDVDILVGPGGLPLTYVESDLPMAIWTDCTFASLEGYYAKYTNMSERTRRNGHEAERRVLERADVIVMACEWAARSAIDDYGTDPAKVHVVPFGANLPVAVDAAGAMALAEARPEDTCELLFLGVDWERKGGDIAMQVAEQLHAAGRNVRLTVVGVDPPISDPPPWLRSLGFIAKNTDEGLARLQQLLGESHFLLLPTQAECFGIVFAEAAAHALPSLAPNTGGVPNALIDGRNGHLFELSEPAEAWVDRIASLLDDRDAYLDLCRRSRATYEDTLNWDVCGARVHELLRAQLQSPGVPESSQPDGAAPAAPRP